MQRLTQFAFGRIPGRDQFRSLAPGFDGAIAACGLAAVYWQWTLVAGIALPAQTGVLVAFWLAVSCGLWFPATRLPRLLWTVFAAGLLAAGPWCYAPLAELASRNLAAESPVSALFAAFSVTAIVIGPVCWLLTAGLLPRFRTEDAVPLASRPAPISDWKTRLLGAAVGMVAAVAVIGPWGGGTLLASVAAVGLAALWVCPRWSTSAAPTQDSSIPRDVGVFGVEVLATLAGCLVICQQRLFELVTLGSPMQTGALVAGVLLGTLLALRPALKNADAGQKFPVIAWGAPLCAACAAAWLALFPTLALAMLWTNSYVSWQVGVLGLRSLLWLASGLPVGVLLGSLWQQSGDRKTHGATLLLFGLGLAFAPWALKHVALTTALLGIVGGLVVMSLFATWSAASRMENPNAAFSNWFRGSRVRIAGTVAAVGCLAAGALSLHTFDPVGASRTLFSTRAFVAYRGGLDYNLLAHLDEGRVVSHTTGDVGSITLANYGGAHLQLRNRGIPVGTTSVDGTVFPQFSGEVLPVVFSLTLHDRPQNLLVLGLGAGTSLSTSRDFPLQHMVCVEPDVGVAQVWQKLIAPRLTDRPRDDRISLLIQDPLAYLANSRERFDVIVSCTGQAAAPENQVQLTASYFRRVQRRLAPDGVYCQRWSALDLGPDALRTVIRSMHSVFHEVQAVETAPGELSLFATDSPQGLVRGDLFHRLQAPQVRTALANVGLDWSVLVNLSWYQHESLRTFASAQRTPLWLAESRLPFVIPGEIVRWGSKVEELQAALGLDRTRLAAALGEQQDSPNLLRRLSDVVTRGKLLSQHGSQFWAYRAVLRDQIANRPVKAIQQVSASAEQMTNDDRRRIGYFKDLARAVASKEPADIERVESYAVPYDPLLTDFSHYEAAELYAKLPEPQRLRELRNRLYTIYFSSSQDGSVRSIVACLDLLREHPELVPDADQRYDLVNGLLQSMQLRWNVRAGVPPQTTTRAVLRDIDNSLVAGERSLALLESTAKDAQIPAEVAAARKRALERTLLRPLQQYQLQVRHHQKTSGTKTAQAAAGLAR